MAESGVGVVDRVAVLLRSVAEQPRALAALVEDTGMSRTTVHRLAVALEHHGLLDRDEHGRFVVGPGLVALTDGGRPTGVPSLPERAVDVLATLRDRVGESTQLYVRRGPERVCLASAERGTGLRDTVPVGAVLPLTAGSAAQVLLAWEPVARVAEVIRGARFSGRTLADVRRRGWAHSVAEREAGVASVSAPVRSGSVVVAAVSVSGPAERLGRGRGPRAVPDVVAAARELSS